MSEQANLPTAEAKALQTIQNIQREIDEEIKSLQVRTFYCHKLLFTSSNADQPLEDPVFKRLRDYYSSKGYHVWYKPDYGHSKLCIGWQM